MPRIVRSRRPPCRTIGSPRFSAGRGQHGRTAGCGRECLGGAGGAGDGGLGGFFLRPLCLICHLYTSEVLPLPPLYLTCIPYHLRRHCFASRNILREILLSPVVSPHVIELITPYLVRLPSISLLCCSYPSTRKHKHRTPTLSGSPDSAPVGSDSEHHTDHPEWIPRRTPRPSMRPRVIHLLSPWTLAPHSAGKSIPTSHRNPDGVFPSSPVV